MRLLRRAQTGSVTTSTDLSLTEYFPANIPPSYAILSHRWGADEVTIDDLKRGGATTKAGFKKLEFCSQQAAKDGIDYFWVDTCCIDKSNNTELSEAINSMFRWYQNATKCYVYLPDVSHPRQSRATDSEREWRAAFQRSEWFSRGWTLQELIAPKVVEFFSSEGEKLGDEQSLEQEICRKTKIPVEALRGQHLAMFGIEERLGWAAGRDTTRAEDPAYCLLGIFNVYMPLIYGEGRENAMARLKGSFHELHAEERRCHQSLKTSSHEAHKDRNPTRVAGTCRWVLSHPHFCDWYSGKSGALLWISADPGCGKSVLCRSLIDEDLRYDGRTSLCYFFFKDNGEQDTLAPALCAILHQLFTQQPQLLRHAIPGWERDGTKLQHETKSLWRILTACAADPQASPIICVLDALDECQDDDRRQLIDELCKLHQHQHKPSSHKLKVLVTSRPYDNVQRWFASTTTQWPQIRLRGEDENERVHQEINLVIERQVQDLAIEFDLPLADRESLRQQLLQMQHRTYLWLYLAIGEVREVCRESIFQESIHIESLPSSVEDAYERILGKIHDNKRHLARKVLLIVVKNAQKLNPIDAARLEKQIRDQCGLFIYIQNSQLFLIHQTAKEFLMTKTTLSQAQNEWKSSLSVEMIETQMARLCIKFLCLCPLSERPSDFDVRNERRRPYGKCRPGYDHGASFFQYCAENWTSYLQDYMLEGDGMLMKQAMWLYRDGALSPSSWFPYAWRALEPELSLPAPQVQHMIAIFGHATVLDELCRLESIDLEEPDVMNQTVLHVVSEKGHEKLVQMLLDKGVNVHAQGDLFGTALHLASDSGHEKVVQMLLDRGADVNAQGSIYGTALHLASGSGYETVVRVLLDGGVDVNARGGIYDTALQTASILGHEKVVQVLLRYGAV